jgi:hypothetical protein
LLQVEAEAARPLTPLRHQPHQLAVVLAGFCQELLIFL